MIEWARNQSEKLVAPIQIKCKCKWHLAVFVAAQEPRSYCPCSKASPRVGTRGGVRVYTLIINACMDMRVRGPRKCLRGTLCRAVVGAVRTYARLWIKDREDGDCNLEQAGTNTVRSVNDLIISSYYHPWTRIYSIYGNRDIIDFPRYIIFHSYKIISLSFFFFNI